MKINIQSIKNFIKPVYYWFYFRYYYTLELVLPSKIKNPKDIPIIINNFNRLSYLKLLIEALEQRGYFNIQIIDNASTYPPLLEYYKDCHYRIFRLEKNTGQLALWESDVYKHFINDYYVYTDSDIVPVKECPDDFMEVFLETMRKYKFARKVGFSLKIDNLPEFCEMREEILKWEEQYHEFSVDDLLYRAPIDTTFALYRPRAKGGSNSYVPMYRTKFPYEAEHLPWYIDSKNMQEEDIFYIRNAKTTTMWTEMNKRLLL